MNLTELEQTILFDAITLYKKTHTNELRRDKAGREKDDAISALRSKLKKILAKT